jgi:hypothetical protein
VLPGWIGRRVEVQWNDLFGSSDELGCSLKDWCPSTLVALLETGQRFSAGRGLKWWSGLNTSVSRDQRLTTRACPLSQRM